MSDRDELSALYARLSRSSNLDDDAVKFVAEVLKAEHEEPQWRKASHRYRENLASMFERHESMLPEGAEQRAATIVERAILAAGCDLYDEKIDNATPGRRAHLVRVSDFPPESIEWLWHLRLARGKLTLLAGDPGVGKTYLALAIAAALTRGTPLPDDETTRTACDVIYMTREDGIGDTLRPRLDGLGADVGRVHVLVGADDGSPVSLTDVDIIGDAIKTTKGGLVVVDPVQSWLGARVDAHRANETRPILDALAATCARHNCACVIIAHTAKVRGGRAVTAALGSIDFAGAARFMMVAGADPNERGQNVLACAKTNLGPTPASVAYSVDGETGVFSWLGAVEVTAADVLAADASSDEERTAVGDAVNWLRAELASGPRPAAEVKEAAHAAGIPESTLRRALRFAKVRKVRVGFGRGGEWRWSIDTIDAQNARLSVNDTYDPPNVETGVI